MTQLQTTVTVQPDGNIIIPVGREDAGQSFLVQLTPLTRKKVTSEQALASLNKVIGAWKDFGFIEPDDLPPEDVEPLK